MKDRELKKLGKAELLEILLEQAEDGEKKQELPKIEVLEQAIARERQRRRYWRTLLNTISILIVAAAAAVLLSFSLFPVYRIYGESMAPNLTDGDVVVAVRTSRPDAGDVTAFYYNNKILIKRVIAREGDWVSIEENGDVYVNQELLEEPYLTKKALGDCETAFPCQVPDGQFFVLGDNREVSADSRSEAVGFVDGEELAGKLLFRIWPLERIGAMN